MTTILSLTVSDVLTTTPSESRPTSSVGAASNSTFHLTTPEIVVIVVGSVVFCLLSLLIVFWFLRRLRQKYRYPEDASKNLDSVETASGAFTDLKPPFQDDWRSISEHGETPSLLTARTQQSFNRSSAASETQYLRDAYARPSSFVNDYEAPVTYETPTVPSDSIQSPTNTAGSETATFQPSFSNPTTGFAPLRIHKKSRNNSNGSGSVPTSPDSGLEADETGSLYSEASASISYPSKSFLRTVTPPPVPPIPLHFNTTIQSTPLESVLSTGMQEDEKTTINPYRAPYLSASPPSLRFSKEVDEAEIYNVARLIYSRQSKAAKARDRESRASSIVSHIERSGSIRPVILPEEEAVSEPYRPRYYRLKQKKNSHSSNLSPTYYSHGSFLSMSHSQEGS